MYFPLLIVDLVPALLTVEDLENAKCILTAELISKVYFRVISFTYTHQL